MDIPDSMTPVIGLVAAVVIIGAIVTVIVRLVRGREADTSAGRDRRRRDAEGNDANPTLYGAAGLAAGAGIVGVDGARKDDAGGPGSGGDGGTTGGGDFGSGGESGGGGGFGGSGGGGFGGDSGGGGRGGGFDGGGAGGDGGGSF